MSKKTFTAKSTENKTINMIFTSLIALFMLIIPFFRGLFFRMNYIPAIICVSIIFVAFMMYKLKDKNYKVLGTYMDLTVLLIPVAYLISFFFAVNAKDAFDMVLLYSSYFMMYKLASDLSSKDEKYKDIFINVIIASTLILSLTAIFTIAGVLDLKGVFVGKRLYGLYQYANTTASVLGVGIILSLNKLISEESTKKAVLYQMILTALISSFIFTLSRGGYLVLAGVLLLNFLLIKARAKLKFLLSLFISFLSNLVFIYKYYTLAEETISKIWVYYIISIIMSAIIIYIIYSFKNRIKLKFSEKGINIALITMAIIFAGVAAVLFSVKEPLEYRIEHQATEEKSWKNKGISLYELEPNSKYTFEFEVKASVESPRSYGVVIRSYNGANEYTEILNHFESIGSEFTQRKFDFMTLESTERALILLYNYETDSYTQYNNVVIKDSNAIVVKKMEKLKYVPTAIVDRMADISLDTKNAASRIYFATDGLKIIKDYPIAGAGGGAWKSLYRQYQSIPYNTTEVHNFYVQYGTEVGIIGLVALIVLLLLLIIYMIRSIKANSHYLNVYLAAMFLFIHSTIDFNLSLAAVGYMLWMLIGIISSDRNTPLAGKRSQKYIVTIILAISILVLYASSSIYYGTKIVIQGANIYNESGSADKAIELYEKASRFDRYNTMYRIDMAQIMNNQLRKTKDRRYLDEFNKQISLIQKYEPYNHQYTPLICSIYLNTGNFEGASNLAEKKLRDEPLLVQSYTLLIDINYEMAQYYLKENKIQEAITYLEKVLKTDNYFEETNKTLKQPMKLTEDYLKKVEAVSKTLEMIKADLKQ